MRIAVDHLASLGHTWIGLTVGPERYVPVIRKIAAFGTAIGAHRLGEAMVEHFHRCRGRRHQELTRRMLLGEVAGIAARREEYLFQPELVVRSSTGPAPRERRAGHKTAGQGHAVDVKRRR